MNAHVLRALILDAWYQVMDNWVFRIGLVCVMGLILFTFLVAFRNDGIVLLWGMTEISYAELVRFLGGGELPPDVDLQTEFIRGVTSLVIETMAGTYGMMFCLSASAFFVPRMLEKGSADVLLSKPVSRAMLLLSRYAAGLLLVGLLGTFLVVGLYAGLRINADYNDPGILWGAVTLVYLFGLLHAVSVCIGAFTRSTVTAILLTLLFFMGTGCLHQTWIVVEQQREVARMAKARIEARNELRGTAAEASSAEAGPEAPDAPAGFIVRNLVRTVELLHFTLPKTSDADLLTRMLRRSVEGSPTSLADPDLNLRLRRAPPGWERLAPDSGSADRADLGRAPARYELELDGEPRARLSIARGPRRVEGRALTTSGAARAAQSRLQSRLGKDVEVALGEIDVDELPSRTLTWTEAGWEHVRVVIALRDWIVELEWSADVAWLDPPGRRARLSAFLDEMNLGRESDVSSPSGWYEQRFGWTSELRYNAFFSIGTSLLFVAAMLALAAWRVSRIDF